MLTNLSKGLYIPYFYILDFAGTRPPNSVSTYALAIMNAGGFLGRTIMPFFSDRLGRFNLLFPCAFWAGLSCLALWLPAAYSSERNRIILEVVFAAVYGFLSGGFISLINVCVSQLCDISEVGGRLGLLYCLISFP